MGCLPFKNLSPDDPLDGNGTLMSSEETTTHSKPSFVFSTIRISSSFFIKQFSISPYDHYEKIRSMGTGASAEVLKVRHKKTGIFRALKSINLSFKDAIELTNHEISMLKLLDHPNIMKLYDTYNVEKVSYDIITELIPGGEIFMKLKSHNVFTEEIACRIMTQLLSAIKECHDNNIVHRDIKPENIILYDEKNFEIKLIAFGTGKILQKGEKCSDKIGTPTYIAPEILRGDPYDFKCDLWSAGVLLYVMLSGDKPFKGLTEEEIFISIKGNELNFDKKEWDNVSKSGKDLVKKMLNKNPEQRISAEAALNSEWIKTHTSKTYLNSILDNKSLLESICNNINSFNPKNKLQIATLIFIIHFNVDLYNDEVSNITKLFKFMDSDNDGLLSKTECLTGMNQLFKNKDLTAIKLFDIFTDKNDPDPHLKYEEFITACITRKNILNVQNIQNAFMIFDESKSGKITYDDMRTLLYTKDISEDVFNKIVADCGITKESPMAFGGFNQMIKELIV